MDSEIRVNVNTVHAIIWFLKSASNQTSFFIFQRKIQSSTYKIIMYIYKKCMNFLSKFTTRIKKNMLFSNFEVLFAPVTKEKNCFGTLNRYRN